MLAVPAPFPFPGAEAFLVPGGEPCRILQTRRDGRLLISLTGVSNDEPDLATRASGNRTVDPAEIFATKEEAVDPRARARRQRKARRGARR